MSEVRYGRRDPADTIHDRLGPAPAPELIVPVLQIKTSSIKRFLKKIFGRRK